MKKFIGFLKEHIPELLIATGIAGICGILLMINRTAAMFLIFILMILAGLLLAE